MDELRVYTDGACSGSKGGWAWVAVDGQLDYGPCNQTTNNRMELTAVLRAIESLDCPIKIVSDSKYVIDCFERKWYKGWMKNNWQRKDKQEGWQPVKNRDLWEPLVDAVITNGVTFEWVKGHSGDEFNELADMYAVLARKEFTSYDQRGIVEPDELKKKTEFVMACPMCKRRL